MNIFVDTSAFIIMLNRSDSEHRTVLALWNDAVQQDYTLVTTNYVVVETIALLQRRFGMPAVRLFLDRLFPALEINWIEPALHIEATAMLRTANQRDLSLVDCVSFSVMRQMGISDVLAFDKHFEEQGFTCLH